MKKIITTLVLASFFLAGCVSSYVPRERIPAIPVPLTLPSSNVSVNVTPEVKAPAQTSDASPSIPAKTSAKTNFTKLAKCLTQSDAIMYGAYWCPHCKVQKSLFGEDFQYIKYQECDPNGEDGDPKACNKAKVEGYPSWGIPGQKNLVGEQTLEDLAKWANCPLT